MLFVERIILETGAVIGIPDKGRPIYFPTKATIERTRNIKHRLSRRSRMSKEQKELTLHKRRQLLEFGVCDSGNKLIDDMLKYLDVKGKEKDAIKYKNIQRLDVHIQDVLPTVD